MSLRHAVLGLLAEFPGSGYDLMKVFDISLRNVWPASQSQVYSELNALAADGLIAVSATGPRGRKEYVITDDGTAELRRWLAETRPARNFHVEGLLRVHFLGQLPPDQAREYLTWLAEANIAERKKLRELEAEIAGDTRDLALYGRLALEYGLRNAAMTAEWAAWAAERIDDIESVRAGRADSGGRSDEK